MPQPTWASMRTAPRDGTLVLVQIRATEQGPAEVDAVRFAQSARSGEEGWVANDSDPFARVVIVTGHGDPVLAERGLAAGALAYVTKLVAGDALVPAVHAALRGERVVAGVCVPGTAGEDRH